MCASESALLWPSKSLSNRFRGWRKSCPLRRSRFPPWRRELLEKSPDARRIAGFHTSPEEAGRIFERIKPKLAVYTHVVLLTTDPSITPPPLSDLTSRTRTTYQGPLEIGEDLMTILVGDSVSIRRFNPPAR